MNRLDLIIECMDEILNDELPSPEKMMTAYRYAHELRALKPVARVILTEHLGMPIMQWIDLDRSFNLDSGALLYALDEVKHD